MRDNNSRVVNKDGTLRREEENSYEGSSSPTSINTEGAEDDQGDKEGCQNGKKQRQKRRSATRNCKYKAKVDSRTLATSKRNQDKAGDNKKTNNSPMSVKVENDWSNDTSDEEFSYSSSKGNYQEGGANSNSTEDNNMSK